MIYVNICFLGVFWYVRAEPTYCARILENPAVSLQVWEKVFQLLYLDIAVGLRPIPRYKGGFHPYSSRSLDIRYGVIADVQAPAFVDPELV